MPKAMRATANGRAMYAVHAVEKTGRRSACNICSQHEELAYDRICLAWRGILGRGSGAGGSCVAAELSQQSVHSAQHGGPQGA